MLCCIYLFKRPCFLSLSLFLNIHTFRFVSDEKKKNDDETLSVVGSWGSGVPRENKAEEGKNKKLKLLLHSKPVRGEGGSLLTGCRVNFQAWCASFSEDMPQVALFKLGLLEPLPQDPRKAVTA